MTDEELQRHAKLVKRAADLQREICRYEEALGSGRPAIVLSSPHVGLVSDMDVLHIPARDHDLCDAVRPVLAKRLALLREEFSRLSFADFSQNEVE